MIQALAQSSLLLFMVMVFALGTIIGSFLNVVIYRFNTGRSLNGHSHCLSCGNSLRWFDLFPVFSYLWLRGRCRVCGCHFTARYLAVEIGTGLLFVLSAGIAVSLTELLLLWLLMAVLMIIFVYDIRHYIIPDALTLLTIALVVALTVPHTNETVFLTSYAWDVVAAALGAGFLLFLWLVSSGKWIGFGDVKLAFPLALLVGAQSVFSMIVCSFWIGAAVSLLLLGLAKVQRGKLALPFMPSGLTIKSVVPFAPFLIAGSLLVLFTNINVLNLFTF